MLRKLFATGFQLSTKFSKRSAQKFRLLKTYCSATTNMVDITQYSLPNDSEVCLLDCSSAFNLLDSREKLYAHYIAKASFNGGLIVLLQTSPESPGIYLVLQRLFQAKPLAELRAQATQLGWTADDFKALLVYSSGLLANMGNYKGFGDSKFVPLVPKGKLQSLVAAQDSAELQGLWDLVQERMYSLQDRQLNLGLGPKGTTTYFSSNCELADAEFAQQFLDEKGLSAYNTRLFKTGEKEYLVKLASANASDEGLPDGGKHSVTSKKTGATAMFTVSRGDYSQLMGLVADDLTKAQEFAANENQLQMLENYCKSFREGSIPAHKDGSRFWIKDKGPVVESYIGFIESYRDPFGSRGEFEGFAAMVNKEMSAKFGKLVEQAEHFLPLLPWPRAYEKDTFLRPDFTSLDVLGFAGSGIPAGINIPNYDDIRQSEGFKNVSLGNVLSSSYKADKNITFLAEADKELFSTLKVPAFEVQVGLHELLGHGSGKLFYKKPDGTFNFDQEHTKQTETDRPITSWYEEGETWDSKFPVIGSSYEECRAECVGLYLCFSTDVLNIFGHHGSTADDIIYVNWLIMVRAGLMALEFYSPDTKAWRQAHMNARFVILRVLLEAGEDLVTVEQVMGADGTPDLVVKLNRAKMLPTGKEAIGNFLRKLQFYKSTGDYTGGKAMYDHYSSLTDGAPYDFTAFRKIVLARKQPRKMFVQCNTNVAGSDVELKEYSATQEGLVESWTDRFPLSHPSHDVLNQLWRADAKYFS